MTDQGPEGKALQYEQCATDIACERENYGFDNYVELIRRALYDAHIAGAEAAEAKVQGLSDCITEAEDALEAAGRPEGERLSKGIKALEAKVQELERLLLKAHDLVSRPGQPKNHDFAGCLIDSILGLQEAVGEHARERNKAEARADEYEQVVDNFNESTPKLYERIAELHARAVMAEHHKALSLLGKSSYQEQVEEGLRVQLAEAQIRADELEREATRLNEACQTAENACASVSERNDDLEREVARLKGNGHSESAHETHEYIEPVPPKAVTLGPFPISAPDMSWEDAIQREREPTEPTRNIAPIPLNAQQEQAIKGWAADDRLWWTPEDVQFNLRTFARVILKENQQDCPDCQGVGVVAGDDPMCHACLGSGKVT